MALAVEGRPVGRKPMEEMKKQGATKVSYDGLMISTAEADKKAGFLAIKEARESMKDWLGKSGKKIVAEILERNKKGKPILLLRNDFGKNKLYVLNIKNNRQLLFRLNDAYLFYDVVTEVYTRYKKELHKNGKEVIFPEIVAPEIKQKIAS
jgi:hypothetical protein